MSNTKQGQRSSSTILHDAVVTYLHDVVDVLYGAEPLSPQLKARGHLQLGEARLQVQLDTVAGPSLPSAKLVRRLPSCEIP